MKTHRYSYVKAIRVERPVCDRHARKLASMIGRDMRKPGRRLP